MTFETYEDLVCDYFFSNKEIKEYTKQQQQTLQLAVDIITTHGVGGKFVEQLIRHNYNLEDPDAIHGWDGFDGNIPIEIKTETINNTKKLNCEGSFGEHRKESVRKKDLFIQYNPHLYSVGVHESNGKCLYIMKTEIGKIDRVSLLFERLDAKSPRISFTHWKDYTDAYSIIYKNNDLVVRRAGEFNKSLLKVLMR